MKDGSIRAAAVLMAAFAVTNAAAADTSPPSARKDIDEAWGRLVADPRRPTQPAVPVAGPGAKFAPPPLKFDDAGVSRWVADHANLDGWVRASFSEQVVAFVQQDKPKLGDWPLVRTQVRYESFAPVDGAPYPSQRADLEFDCAHDRARFLTWDIYREPGLKGGVADRPDFDTKTWTYPQPYTVERDLVVHVCDWAASLRESRR